MEPAAAMQDNDDNEAQEAEARGSVPEPHPQNVYLKRKGIFHFSFC